MLAAANGHHHPPEAAFAGAETVVPGRVNDDVRYFAAIVYFVLIFAMIASNRSVQS
jgi:hypothetical protein